MNVVQIYRGSDGQHYLRLVSPNGQVLAQSEGYHTRWNARRAARKNFAGLRIVELDRKGRTR